MRGVPGRIATRYDIELLRAWIGSAWDTPESRSAVLAQLQAIRATAHQYVFTRLLAAEAERAGPEPAYRVLAGQGEAGDEFHEYQLQRSPHSRLDALGLSLEELDALIAEVGNG